MPKKRRKRILVISPYLPLSGKANQEFRIDSLLKGLSQVGEVFFAACPTFPTFTAGTGITAFSFEESIEQTFICQIKEQLLGKYIFDSVIIISHRLATVCLRELSSFSPVTSFLVYLPDLKGFTAEKSKISVYGSADLILTRTEADKNLVQKRISFSVPVRTFSADRLTGVLSALEKKHRRPRNKLTSIIILTHNGLRYTKDCIRSLKQYTGLPYELIFVDNGSSDGTAKYLKSIPRTKVIFNSCNLAFSKGNNQAIKHARGDYILLLNSDVVLTEGWLEGLLKWMESDSSIGILGPCTNTAVGEQVVADVPRFKTMKDLQYFAQAFRLEHSGTCREVNRIIGFCMLIRREVIDKVGLLDERFGPGGYEDYDYCLRVRQRGYRIAIAGDVFVFHHGGKSAETISDYENLRAQNREIFIEKWTRKALEFLEEI